MIELLRTNDLVFISWLTSVLEGVGIEVTMLDEYTSNLEGSSPAIKRRLMVEEDNFNLARSTFKLAVAELNEKVGSYEFSE
ncbi:MAG: DUF2007 domain-containing protein [Pseudomonadota bacterium]|nr:DUF2007 domain-containing protein [Pseudomonadota bacterium]